MRLHIPYAKGKKLKPEGAPAPYKNKGTSDGHMRISSLSEVKSASDVKSFTGVKPMLTLNS